MRRVVGIAFLVVAGCHASTPLQAGGDADPGTLPDAPGDAAVAPVTGADLAAQTDLAASPLDGAATMVDAGAGAGDLAKARADLATPGSFVDGGLQLSFADSLDTSLFTNGDVDDVEVAVVDLDSDGKLDVVVAAPGADKVAWLRGDGAGKLAGSPGVAVDPGPRGLAVGDFDEDGHPDVAVACGGGDTINVLRGGKTGLGTPARYDAANARGVGAGDLDDDGHQDLVVGTSGYTAADQVLRIFYGRGDGTFDSAVTVDVKVTPDYPMILDVDGDGDQDVLFRISYGFNVLLGNRSRSFTLGANHAAGGPADVAVGDFTGDGKLDVMVALYGTNQTTLSRGMGGGAFAKAETLLLGEETAAVADYDLDGRLDVALQACCNELVIWRGAGDGTFPAMPVYAHVHSPPGMVRPGDFNGDGKPDLVNVWGFGSASVNVSLNTGK